MIRRPPRSTLFPYTRSSDLGTDGRRQSRRPPRRPLQPGASRLRAARARRGAPEFRCAAARSEEHTSELQSQSNLVCRLLLEKKNKKKTYTPTDTYRITLTVL